MLTLLSPAKKLLTTSTPNRHKTTKPLLVNKAMDLVTVMKGKSVNQIADLMDLSQDLATLNFERYQKINVNDCPNNDSYPALFLFQGDVYQGLQALSWSQNDVTFSQSHLSILSGLYGLLKPLDGIQPYRLEMGVALSNAHGKNLYEFWGSSITQLLNEQLANHHNPVLINLASNEYFKAVHVNQLNHPVVTINFYERKNNALKMIGVYAKKARGLMAKYIVQNQIDSLDPIKNFNELGYQFNEQSSTTEHMDFIRSHP